MDINNDEGEHCSVFTLILSFVSIVRLLCGWDVEVCCCIAGFPGNRIQGYGFYFMCFSFGWVYEVAKYRLFCSLILKVLKNVIAVGDECDIGAGSTVTKPWVLFLKFFHDKYDFIGADRFDTLIAGVLDMDKSMLFEKGCYLCPGLSPSVW